MADNFYYVEGSTSVKNLVKTLVTEIVANAGIYKWDLVYPSSINEVGSSSETTINLISDGSTTSKVQTSFTVSGMGSDKCILKATTSSNNVFYVKIDRSGADLSTAEKIAVKKFTDRLKGLAIYNGMGNWNPTQAEILEMMANVYDQNVYDCGGYDDYVSAKTKSGSLNNIMLQISDTLNTAGDDIVIAKDYHQRLSWYRTVQPGIKDFLPVEYWLNVTKDAINLVLRGDPSADVSPYQNYLTSYAYIGSLKPVEDSATTDDKYNFGITTGSDAEPAYSQDYGERTATGITDFCMIANKIGLPYQPHYPGFYTTNPFMDKCNVEGSRWNHKKHQFSDITLVHPVDMERGKMINVLAGDASSIYDMDKLAYKKDTVDEEYYKKFKITAPYNFLNNSANINYAIAIRCYKTVE